MEELKKSLFKVVDTKTGKTIKDGFVKKKCAKDKRDELNKPFQTEGSPLVVFRHIVMRSKDHWKKTSPVRKNMYVEYQQPKMVKQDSVSRNYWNTEQWAKKGVQQRSAANKTKIKKEWKNIDPDSYGLSR